MDTSTLTSLAMLKVNKDVRDSDYLEYLVPFVIEVLRVHNPDPVTDADVSQHLRGDFGLRIPNRGIQLVLTRLRKRGFLEKNHQILRIARELPDSEIGGRRVRAAHQIEIVLEKLRTFAAIEYSKEWSLEEATETLIAYLSLFAVECLRTYVHGTALPPLSKKKRAKDVIIVHAFVRDTYRDSVQDFDNFMVLVKGHMLANALLCPDLESLQRKFDEVEFYLDTPIVLRLLGLGEDVANEATLELLELLHALKGTVVVFDHTLDEINRVLRSAEKHFDRVDNQGTILRVMRRKGRNVSDLTLIRSQLAERLRNLGIGRRKAPRHRREYQIDESLLGEALDEEIGYYNPNALQHDVDSVRCIFALREGSHPMRLEDAKAVFVTSNGPFARLAFEHGREFEHSREISSVITDFSLANVAWLKAPLGAPELPEREVIAACFAALEPPSLLWKKYLSELDELEENGSITAHDHQFLRYELQAREELMDMTFGDPDLLAKESIPVILERAKQELVREERERNTTLTHEIRVLRERHSQIRSRLFWISERIGQVAKYAVASILLLAAIFASGIIPQNWLTFLGKLRLIGGAVASVVALGIILGMVDLTFGLSIKDILGKIDNKAGALSLRLLSKAFLGEIKVSVEPSDDGQGGGTE